MLREYLKLSRSFNAGLTGIAPVLGAISMGEGNILPLFLLFLVGFFGHIYGFAVNDIMDLKVDSLSKDLRERPLVSGKISTRTAWIFALSAMILSFLIAIFLGVYFYSLLSLPFLIFSAISITIYDLISKKYPAMDIFVGSGIFLLILYGASSVNWPISSLAWIVCSLGTLQVLFMQFIIGGMKDVEHDYKGKANTLAIKMGARIKNGMMIIPKKFMALAYGIEIVYLAFLFIPFIYFFDFEEHVAKILILIFLSIVMFFVSKKLLEMKKFDRNRARKLIGIHYSVNYSLVPIMLMALNPWIGLLIVVPPAAFLLSNLGLHGLFQPKTM